MSVLTRVMLLISYAVFALAVAVFLPRLFGADPTLAMGLAGFLFLTFWHVTDWVNHLRASSENSAKIERLEDVVRLLRMDIERTKRSVQRQEDMTRDDDNDELASELKLLHTLLGQVMRKQSELLEQSEARAAVMANEGNADLLHEGGNADTLAMADEEQGDGAAVEGASMQPADMIFESESESVIGVKSPTASPLSGRVPVRLIQDEERLMAVIRNSLSENRVDLYLQPTMKLPGRQVTHFECFSRVRDEDGRVLLPRQYMAAAEQLALAGTLDNLLLFRLIQLLRRLGARKPDMRFFCNLSKQSLEDEEFFPQFTDFMLSNSEFVDRLVFEITQHDFDQLDQTILDRLMTMGRRGFGFCLDRVQDLDALDLKKLENYHFKFLKVDWKYLSETFAEDGIALLVRSLRSRGVQLIGAQIENDDDAMAIAESDMELGQGYAFGEPAPAQHYAKEL